MSDKRLVSCGGAGGVCREGLMSPGMLVDVRLRYGIPCPLAVCCHQALV